MKATANFIKGGTYHDKRGNLAFVNDFVFNNVKRFYHIENTDRTIVRAWQGHMVEEKWFYVLEGSFKVVLVKIDNWDKPSVNLLTEQYNLEALNGILYIPAGYANGFQATAPKSKVIIFSSLTAQESANDDYRFDHNLWFNWNND